MRPKSADYERFLVYVKDTMFSDSRTHSVHDPQFWPMVSPEYRYQHTLHVRRYIELLQAQEGGELDVLITSAIFHDISHFRVDYRGHGRVSAQMTRDYLSGAGYDQDFVDRVYLTVDDHSSDKPMSYYQTEAPLESRLLIEADFLDKIGPVGVFTQLLHDGSHRRLWKEIEGRFQQYLVDRGNRALNNPQFPLTLTAQRLVREKVDWTQRFLEDVRREIAFEF